MKSILPLLFIVAFSAMGLAQPARFGMHYHLLSESSGFKTPVRFYNSAASKFKGIMIDLPRVNNHSAMIVKTWTANDIPINSHADLQETTLINKRAYLPENLEKMRQRYDPQESYLYELGFNLLVNFLANGW